MDLKELAQQKKGEKKLRHPWELARLEFIHKKIQKYLSPNCTPIFLDIGCGDTFVAEQLMKRIPNSSFYCIDNAFTEKQLLQYSKLYKNANIKVFSKLEDATAQIDTNISFVLILDVMEHIDNDVDFLVQIEQLEQLNSKSNILITVPAFQSLFTHHDHVLGHFRRYTNRSLEKTTLKSGLKTIEKGYFFSTLLVPRFFIKIKDLLFKSNSKSTSIATWNNGWLITSLFKNILILDFSITSILEKIHIKPFGLSNYIVCRKHVS